jgi:predicted transcriptional regulator
MAVIRIQKTENYTVMSNHHLRNKDMSLKAKGLMSLMLSLPPQWDYSIGGLVAICKESHTSIRSAIKELEENNYLIRERKNNEKGYFVYEYILYEIPQPHTGNQHTVEKYAENTHTENDRQISKDELITNKLNIDELNKDKDKEKIDDILMSVGNADLIELYWDYIDVRKGMDAPLSPRALQMLITRCERLSKNNIKVQKLLLENAIINGWKNVFLPKESELESIGDEYRDDMRELLGL